MNWQFLTFVIIDILLGVGVGVTSDLHLLATSKALGGLFSVITSLLLLALIFGGATKDE